jgi:hypothetical protein
MGGLPHHGLRLAKKFSYATLSWLITSSDHSLNEAVNGEQIAVLPERRRSRQLRFCQHRNDQFARRVADEILS